MARIDIAYWRGIEITALTFALRFAPHGPLPLERKDLRRPGEENEKEWGCVGVGGVN